MSGRVTLFSTIAALVYTIASYLNLSVIRYYPVSGHFAFHAGEQGMVILWYGWILAAALAGAAVSLAMPRRWLDRLPSDLNWMVLTAALFAILIYEKRWFF